MLAIWNRKEVMLTNDMERLVKARYALQGAGIVYTLKTKKFFGSSSWRSGYCPKFKTSGCHVLSLRA